MPHLTVLYTANLEQTPGVDLDRLCRNLADAMLAVRDEKDQAVFPVGGVRVLAYPSIHYAVADGKRDYLFIYMNLRMGRGRSELAQQRAGNAILAAAKADLAAAFEQQHIGLTVQVDEGPEVFDARHSTIHPLFRKEP
jgi:5-carboxymethyl-2-hydroxymuconate isomerase